MVPLIVLCGQAGSGKDTLGNYLTFNHGATCIAFADPIKRICQYFFDFTDEQLWGPSEFRGGIDERYTGTENQEKLRTLVDNKVLCIHSQRGELSDIVSSNLGSYDKLKDCIIECRNKALEGLSPRYCLQTLGTEWGRSINPNLWVQMGIDTAFKLLGNPDFCYKPQTGIKPREKPDLRWGPTGVVITDGRFRNEILGVLRVGGKALKIDRPTMGPNNSPHRSETESTEIPLSFFDYVIHNNSSLRDLKIKASAIIEKAWKRGSET